MSYDDSMRCRHILIVNFIYIVDRNFLPMGVPSITYAAQQDSEIRKPFLTLRQEGGVYISIRLWGSCRDGFLPWWGLPSRGYCR